MTGCMPANGGPSPFILLYLLNVNPNAELYCCILSPSIYLRVKAMRSGGINKEGSQTTP